MKLAERLKNYPKGTVLYHKGIGELVFDQVLKNGRIQCKINDDYITFNSDGYLDNRNSSKLQPSKTCIDWDKQLKPFDQVLVRDCDTDVWRAALFSHYQVSDITGDTICYACGMSWSQCIPFDVKYLGTRIKI